MVTMLDRQNLVIRTATWIQGRGGKRNRLIKPGAQSTEL